MAIGRTLIRDATIVSMDDAIGDLRGDLLVEDARIAAIAPRIDAADAELVDASGFIVIPGLINAHMHTWQTGLRGVAGNWTVLEYFKNMHAGLATLFKPDEGQAYWDERKTRESRRQASSSNREARNKDDG